MKYMLEKEYPKLINKQQLPAGNVKQWKKMLKCVFSSFVLELREMAYQHLKYLVKKF